MIPCITYPPIKSPTPIAVQYLCTLYKNTYRAVHLQAPPRRLPSIVALSGNFTLARLSEMPYGAPALHPSCTKDTDGKRASWYFPSVLGYISHNSAGAAAQPVLCAQYTWCSVQCTLYTVHCTVQHITLKHGAVWFKCQLTWASSACISGLGQCSRISIASHAWL